MMERFDVRGRGTGWQLEKREDGLGAFCWAEEAMGYQKQYTISMILNLFVVVVCGVLAGYLVYHKHDPVPVATPTMDLEKVGSVLEEQGRLKIQLKEAQWKIDALKAKAAQLERMVKTQNVVLQQREQQLKDMAVSVPTQPVILQAIQREAVTEKGLRRVVARNFGDDIAKRVRVEE